MRGVSGTRWKSAARSSKQLVHDFLVSVRVLAQHWERLAGKETIRIEFGLPGRLRAMELIAELLQRHPLHGLLHDKDRMRDSAMIGCYSAEETGTGNSAFEGPSFVCGQSAPDPVILAGLHGPSQAGVSDP